MAPVLYGNPLSTCTQRVRVVARELGVDLGFQPIDFAKGEHKAPEFIARQPFGQVPYLLDGDFVLYESRAIARYLALKYPGSGPKLLPPAADIEATALFEQAASVEGSNFDVLAVIIARERVFKPMFGGKTDEAAVAQAIQALDGKLDAYEKILSKQKYAAGDSLTLVDLFHLPYGSIITSTGYDGLTSEKRPNVARWWKEISSRPTWVATKEEK